MKKIWKFGRTGGTELQVSDDFPVQVPFTDAAPLTNVNLEDQFFSQLLVLLDNSI